MKREFILLLAASLLIAVTVGSKGDKLSSVHENPQPKAGIVPGKVADEHGNPLSNIMAYIYQSEFYNTIFPVNSIMKEVVNSISAGLVAPIQCMLKLGKHSDITCRFHLYVEDDTWTNSTDG